MKATLILCALATCALAGPPVLVRVTPETIAKLQAMTPMTSLQKPDEGEAKVARPTEQSIIKQSVILHDANNWTLVPIGAVVYLPDALKARVNARPVGLLLPWSEFLTKNIAWITTTDVSFEQAAGSESLPATRVAFWAKQDKVVIAVHQAGPISVRLSNNQQAATQR